MISDGAENIANEIDPQNAGQADPCRPAEVAEK